MPPAYLKPYVKRQKNDATDAEAICEAVARANMRFVPAKTPEQQSGLVLHRTRQLFVRQLTAVTNAIRAQLAEFGIAAPVGPNCSLLSRVRMTSEYPRLRGCVSRHSASNCEDSRSRF
jgi:transposase